jgi:lipoate-protein ligase A
VTDAEVSPSEEQAWNAAALATPVVAPAVRVWRYRTAAVVLGRGQRPDEEMAARARRAGVALVERASGGGAVLAGPWLIAATIVLPPGHRRTPASIPASYGWLGEAHVGWLSEAGVTGAQVAGHTTPAGALRWACYAGLGHGEVVAGGRKLVGLAQARRRNGTLFVAGTLFDETPWPLLCEVMGQPPEAALELAASTASCLSLGGSGEKVTLARRLAERLRDAL